MILVSLIDTARLIDTVASEVLLNIKPLLTRGCWMPRQCRWKVVPLPIGLSSVCSSQPGVVLEQKVDIETFTRPSQSAGPILAHPYLTTQIISNCSPLTNHRNHDAVNQKAGFG